MKKVCFINCFKVRPLSFLLALFVTVNMYAGAFTPTDGGLVVNLKRGQRILISTMVDKLYGMGGASLNAP